MQTNENLITNDDRTLGIDLFKIISMLMVVVLHILGAGGTLTSLPSKSANWFLLGCLENTCIIAVNCFALVSGYLHVGKKIKIKNIFNLYLQVLFYSLMISIVLFVFGLVKFSTKELLNQVLPILSGRYWYFSAYFILFLIMPLLNIILEKTDKAFLLAFLIGAIVFFGVYVFCGSVLFSDVFNIKGGYTFVWLAVCYLIGGAIKKYNLKNLLKARNWFLLYLSSTLLSYLVGLVLSVIRGFSRLPYVADYNFLLNVTSSIFLLLFFARLQLKPNKMISFIAKSSFGVYLLHEQKLLKGIAITNKFVFISAVSPIFSTLTVIGIAVLIYVLGTLFDLIRQYLFKLIKVDKLSKKIDDYTLYVYEKIKHKIEK